MGQNIEKLRAESRRGNMLLRIAALALACASPAVLCLVGAAAAKADDADASPETWSLHGQITVVDQYHPGFHSPYRGTNSLDPGSRGNETVAATLYAGRRVWNGGQVYADVEIDQGFGISNTFGIAGFPSGEAYKVGDADPYVRLHELFFRQAIDLGGDQQKVDPGANQLGMTQT